MSKERRQLNINIDPELLISLKSQAIKSGKTLTEFVTEKLKNSPKESSKTTDLLESRLLKVEKILNLNNTFSQQQKSIGCIFTDEGAKEYGRVAKAEFELHLKKKKITFEEGLKELSFHLKNYPNANPELILQILLGTHDLTGLEMTIAYREGSCAMRSALHDLVKDPLEKLNKAFLDAVITKNLK